MSGTMTVEHINRATGEITRTQEPLGIVDLGETTPLQREMRAMVKAEYRRLGEQYGMSLEETLRMTGSVAQVVAKSAVSEALRDLAEDMKGRQMTMAMGDEA